MSLAQPGLSATVSGSARRMSARASGSLMEGGRSLAQLPRASSRGSRSSDVAFRFTGETLLNVRQIGNIPQMDDKPAQRPGETAEYPQAGRERMILPQPVSSLGTGVGNVEKAMLA